MCPTLVKTGDCPYRHIPVYKGGCSYAHAKCELVSTEAFVKTKLCHNPKSCSYGDNCRYAHDPEELRRYNFFLYYFVLNLKP